MRSLLRYLKFGAALAAGLAGLAVAIVFLSTEPMIRRTYPVPLRSIAVPADQASVAEGRRLAIVRGCFNGCHGRGVQGSEFGNDFWIGRMVAPELTHVLAEHTDAELERVIRRGVRRNGKSTWAMPSSMFFHLTDEDLGTIIAFLRSLPPADGPDAEVRIGPGWRLDLMQDRYLPQAEEIARGAPWVTAQELAGEHGRGRYLALTACTECHGMDLDGAADGPAPNLTVVASYTEQQFAHLMKTGEPIGDRELGLMADVARERFSRLTDDETRALYNYLSARAQGAL